MDMARENTKYAVRNTRLRFTRSPLSLPLEQSCMLAYPAPKQVCVTKAIEITEVKCEDKVENECFNVAKFVDATNTVDQKEVIIGEPSCEQITLTLPTQACSKTHAPAPVYHG